MPFSDPITSLIALFSVLFGGSGLVAGIVALLRVRTQNKLDEATAEAKRSEAEAKEQEMVAKLREQLAAQENQFRLDMISNSVSLGARLEAQEKRMQQLSDRNTELVKENSMLTARITVLEGGLDEQKRINEDLRRQLAAKLILQVELEGRIQTLEKQIYSLERRRLGTEEPHD